MINSSKSCNSLKVEFIDDNYWLTICCSDGKIAGINIGTSKSNIVTNCLGQAVDNGEYVLPEDIFESINSGVN
jgi:hypothetical protein